MAQTPSKSTASTTQAKGAAGKTETVKADTETAKTSGGVAASAENGGKQDTEISERTVRTSEQQNETTDPNVPTPAGLGPAQRGATEESATTTKTRVDDATGAGREEDEEPEPSKKAVEPGEFVYYRGDKGPVFALVVEGGAGAAEVLLMRDSEVPRARSVIMYDSAEDAERAYGPNREHVAYHR